MTTDVEKVMTEYTANQAKEEKKAEEEKKGEEKSTEPTLKDRLEALDGSPAPAQIEAWKAAHGDVYTSGFSPTEMFVWRSMTRSEWVALQDFAAQNNVNQFKFEELVCDTCLLWKSVPGSWENGKAGTPSSLQEQILQNSNFVSPQAASMLVQKL